MKRKFWTLIVVTLLGVVGVVVYWFTTTQFPRPVTAKDIRELCHILSSLFDGKHSLAEAVLITAHRVKNPRLKNTLLRIRKSFDDPNSKPFYELLADYPDVFPREFSLAMEYASKLGRADILLKELAKSWTDDPAERKMVTTQILKSLALQALKDENWFYRSHAIYVLAKLDGKDSIPRILPFLQDPDPRVREAAHRALQELGYKVK
ncbi:MAG: HEAT repeat domain-containing protein [Armatimonadota bacterium]